MRRTTLTCVPARSFREVRTDLVLLQYLNKPAWDPLLPPPLPEPHYRPYTLVIDLEDMLTHDNWDVRASP